MSQSMGYAMSSNSRIANKIKAVEEQREVKHLTIAEMTPIQLQRFFRAETRREIAELRRVRKAALKQEFAEIRRAHLLSADLENSTLNDELQIKLKERKLAEKTLLADAISAKTAEMAQKLKEEMTKKLSA